MYTHIYNTYQHIIYLYIYHIDLLCVLLRLYIYMYTYMYIFDRHLLIDMLFYCFS